MGTVCKGGEQGGIQGAARGHVLALQLHAVNTLALEGVMQMAAIDQAEEGEDAQG